MTVGAALWRWAACLIAGCLVVTCSLAGLAAAASVGIVVRVPVMSLVATTVMSGEHATPVTEEVAPTGPAHGTVSFGYTYGSLAPQPVNHPRPVVVPAGTAVRICGTVDPFHHRRCPPGAPLFHTTKAAVIKGPPCPGFFTYSSCNPEAVAPVVGPRPVATDRFGQPAQLQADIAPRLVTITDRALTYDGYVLADVIDKPEPTFTGAGLRRARLALRRTLLDELKVQAAGATIARLSIRRSSWDPISHRLEGEAVWYRRDDLLRLAVDRLQRAVPTGVRIDPDAVHLGAPHVDGVGDIRVRATARVPLLTRSALLAIAGQEPGAVARLRRHGVTVLAVRPAPSWLAWLARRVHLTYVSRVRTSVPVNR